MQERIDELKKACPCLFQDGAKFWSSDKLTYGASLPCDEDECVERYPIIFGNFGYYADWIIL